MSDQRLYCYRGDGSKTEEMILGPDGKEYTHTVYRVGEIWVDHEMTPEQIEATFNLRSRALAFSMKPKQTKPLPGLGS